jgi:hypothetical protein
VAVFFVGADGEWLSAGLIEELVMLSHADHAESGRRWQTGGAIANGTA